MSKEITATIDFCEQVGPDTWQTYRYSRNFATSRTIDDIISWAKAMGLKDPHISDIMFSEHTGSSI